MRMVIDEGSFKADSTGRLRAIRAGALKARPSESSPVWTLPDEEGSKRDANK
jgi:hypothetical protein